MNTGIELRRLRRHLAIYAKNLFSLVAHGDQAQAQGAISAVMDSIEETIKAMDEIAQAQEVTA